ncbi:esterase/lipase family protein [Demequina muriae]|uniref:Alpha/beta hydrolase n=1 Tax=Demequina muriae TaxID=3051664 RepID=A0ABT8GHJ3_9MICO|nr:alpha/beta hydrolase [Demequina sp. EGI L300058]MDN4480892.1 alpha/beta hydrolase [Demequina sp. EGI L300058]
MKDLFRFWAWWTRDYAYALVWQVRALVNRVHPDSFLTGTRTPVVVLPGIYETWKFMQPLIEQLHAQGHPVHVVADLRRNHRPVTEMAEHVETYLRNNDLEDVLLVAHSKGGLTGKVVMAGPAGDRVRGMLAVATPFGGSRYARAMPLRSLRAFSSRDATITSLARQTTVNGRIVSVYARFDPHIPGGSELPGATNVMLDTGGHFRVLGHPGVLAELATFAD